MRIDPNCDCLIKNERCDQRHYRQHNQCDPNSSGSPRCDFSFGFHSNGCYFPVQSCDRQCAITSCCLLGACFSISQAPGVCRLSIATSHVSPKRRGKCANGAISSSPFSTTNSVSINRRLPTGFKSRAIVSLAKMILLRVSRPQSRQHWSRWFCSAGENGCGTRRWVGGRQ